MKKKICLVLGLVLMIASLSACGSNKEEAKAPESEVVETMPEKTTEAAPEPSAEAISESEPESEPEAEAAQEDITYEFDTFDGEHIVIDSSNIISQDKDENPLETTKVPKEAEVIAPGRDYVYLDDGDYYYVEDTVNNLVTVATKGASKAELIPGLFETDDWKITYDTEKWEGHWDKEGECIITNLNAVAGPSYIHVFELDVKTVDEAAAQIEDMRGKKLTAPSAVTMKENEGYSFWDEIDISAKGPYVFDYYLAFQHKDKVVVINESITHDDDDSRAEALSYEFDDVANTLVLK